MLEQILWGVDFGIQDVDYHPCQGALEQVHVERSILQAPNGFSEGWWSNANRVVLIVMSSMTGFMVQ